MSDVERLDKLDAGADSHKVAGTILGLAASKFGWAGGEKGEKKPKSKAELENEDRRAVFMADLDAAKYVHKTSVDVAKEREVADLKKGHVTHTTDEAIRLDKAKLKNARKDVKKRGEAADKRASEKSDAAAKAKRLAELEKERPGNTTAAKKPTKVVGRAEPVQFSDAPVADTPTTRLMQQERMEVLRKSKYNSEKDNG